MLWSKELSNILPDNCSVILGGILSEPATLLSSKSLESVPNMSWLQHEEADTRIFAHTRHCRETLGYTRVINEATYSDIIMMGICFSTQLPGLSELWIHKANVYLPCHTIASNLEKKYNQYIHPFFSAFTS